MGSRCRLQFLNGRLFTQFNVYKQEINDIVVTYNLPPSSGYFSTLDNLGAMENKGIEIMIGGTPGQEQKFFLGNLGAVEREQK